MAAAAPAASEVRLADSGRAEDWRVLSALGLYRLLLVALLLAVFESGYAAHFFEQVQPRSFRFIAVGYALAALGLMLLVVYRTPRMLVQAYLNFAVDVSAVTLMVYASGGVSNGMGMLLLTPAVGCSLMLTPRMAVLQAATATLAMFSEEALRQLQEARLDASDYTQTGILGLMFFATTVAANAVAQRARRSEELAERVGTQFADLSRLNESIIESMHTGLLVIDAQRRIRTVNAAARRLLGPRQAAPGRLLPSTLPNLNRSLDRWLARDPTELRPFTEARGGVELLPRYTRLGWGEHSPILILVDDASMLREQAQQMKLASLGRLSAGIAHEIRNPLAAISHAGQLLAESPDVGDDDQRLLGMIQRHAGRIDKIVRDVLELARREPPARADIGLRAWLVRTIQLYQEGFPNAPRPLELGDVAANLYVRFDPNHLQQVLFNLWDNSFDHGGKPPGEAVVMIHSGRVDPGGQPYLEVADNGRGIDQEMLDRAFEPFFTTSSSGTGLGLYIARELCEYNQARLVYVPQPQGACLRIVFSQEGRQS
jgi:two-component system sensor histidine kinase PilS (NtrC family)